MDERSNIINDIVLSLSDKLTNVELQEIKNILYVKLDKYEIQERTTELIISDNNSDNLLRRFLATKKIEGKSNATLKHYHFILSRMIQSFDKPISDITVYDLRYYLASYKQTRGVSNVTLDGMRRCIKSFFSFLFTEQLIKSNPSLALSQIKCDKKIKRAFSDVDMELLKRSCKNKRDRALVEFLYSTGCRVSEVVQLNRNDIDFIHGKVIVLGKGNKERIVYLTNITIMYIKEYLDSRVDENPCLFAHIRKPYNRLSKNGIEALLHRIGNEAGVENVHPHRYRRTLATNLIQRGANIQDVATLLGHEDLKTTQIYCCISQDNVSTIHKKYAIG